jgi:hypothetical protein
MQLVFLFKKISLATNLPFSIVVQGFLIAVESAMSLLLYATVVRYTKFKNVTGLLIIGIALNPIPILQVCQQCNFDVLVGFWVLLAVHMLLRFQEGYEARFWLFACFALGMGAATKTVPLSLAPLLLLSARKLKFIEQALGLALLLVPIVLTLSIVYVLNPSDIETKVFGYRSIPGCFGLTGLFAYFGANHLLAIYPKIFEIVYGTGWICLGAWLWLRETLSKQQIVAISVVILWMIPAIGPGSTPGYIYWFMPLLVLMYGMAEPKIRFFLVILYGVGAVTYLIHYALFFQDYGGFLLTLVQTKELLKFALQLSSPAGQTFLHLPLWMFYFISVLFLCIPIGKEMARDFRSAWTRRREPAHRSSSRSG